MTELGDSLRGALQGRSGRQAIETLFTTFHSCVSRHPGRYSATIGAVFRGGDDDLFIAATRVIESIRAVLLGCGVRPGELDHAIRMLRCTLRGCALLERSDGFQWSNDPSESVEWMIGFVDSGLHALRGAEG